MLSIGDLVQVLQNVTFIIVLLQVYVELIYVFHIQISLEKSKAIFS